MVVLEALAAYGAFQLFKKGVHNDTAKPQDAPRQQLQPTSVTATAAEVAGNVHVTVRDAVAELVPRLEKEIAKARAALKAAEQNLAAALSQNELLNSDKARLQGSVRGLEQARRVAEEQVRGLEAKIQRLSRPRGTVRSHVVGVLVHLPLAIALTLTVQKIVHLRAQGKLRLNVDWAALKRCISSSTPALRVDGPSQRYQPTRSPTAELECVVCHENQRDALLLPCRHMALCWPCCEVLADNTKPQCPLCQQAVQAIQYAVVA